MVTKQINANFNLYAMTCDICVTLNCCICLVFLKLYLIYTWVLHNSYFLCRARIAYQHNHETPAWIRPYICTLYFSCIFIPARHLHIWIQIIAHLSGSVKWFYIQRVCSNISIQFVMRKQCLKGAILNLLNKIETVEYMNILMNLMFWIIVFCIYTYIYMTVNWLSD